MDITLTTPALLFPAVSLLQLAYTNRFITLANLIRALHAEHLRLPDETKLSQIANLQHRVYLIRRMQELGVSSILLCVVSMFALFFNLVGVGSVVFAISLVLMAGSLVLSVIEIHISVEALEISLTGMQQDCNDRK